MPERDLLWAYLIIALVVVALAIMGAFYGLTGLFLSLAWERLRPFVPR